MLKSAACVQIDSEFCHYVANEIDQVTPDWIGGLSKLSVIFWVPEVWAGFSQVKEPPRSKDTMYLT